MTEIVHNSARQGASTSPHDPHEEFQELCALSTTGELSAEEWAQLTEHLAHCNACRKLKEHFERTIAIAMPTLAAESRSEPDEESAPGTWPIEAAEDTLMESLRMEPASSNPIVASESSRWSYAYRYAAAAMLLVACCLAGYRFGALRGPGLGETITPTVSSTPGAVLQVHPSNPAVLAQVVKTTPEDDQAAKLRTEIRQNKEALAHLKDELDQSEDKLAKQSADLDRSAQERADLARQLTEAQANSQSLQARLGAVESQTSQDTVQSLELKAQVHDLNAVLEEKNNEITQEQELLQHDRDIRNLIGARNLYIAEIYDVSKTGDTQKPFGRVFYTKDKSLVFYGYDLDQQHGVKQDSAFQAWGRRGTDHEHDISLGLLYQDDANKKRWVLKFNDAKSIAQIDAVFVTVEPEGGSAKPSGKPLLFTYLRLDPNHP